MDKFTFVKKETYLVFQKNKCSNYCNLLPQKKLKVRKDNFLDKK